MGNDLSIILFLIFLRPSLFRILIIKYILSESKSLNLSSPTISTIFNNIKPISFWSDRSSKLTGTVKLSEEYSFLIFLGTSNPSDSKDSSKTISCVEK